MSLVHLSCGVRGKYLGNPEEPPDPDRHGNMRFTYVCPACGARGTEVVAPHGASKAPIGWQIEGKVDWLIPLD